MFELTRHYVIRELTKEGIMARPVVGNWNHGEHLFSDEFYDDCYETHQDAEKAIYDYMKSMYDDHKKSKWGHTEFLVRPCYTVIEQIGFKGE